MEGKCLVVGEDDKGVGGLAGWPGRGRTRRNTVQLGRRGEEGRGDDDLVVEEDEEGGGGLGAQGGLARLPHLSLQIPHHTCPVIDGVHLPPHTDYLN